MLRNQLDLIYVMGNKFQQNILAWWNKLIAQHHNLMNYIKLEIIFTLMSLQSISDLLSTE
jgi:hypothetical protein